MVLVSHRYKFIYLAGFKVASTSVAAFFERYCLPEDQEAGHEPKCESRLVTTKAGFIGPRPSEKGFTPVIIEATASQGVLVVPPGMDKGTFANSIPPMFSHLPLSKILNTPYIDLTFKQLKRYFKFTVVRNPWDVQVSMYHYVCKGNGETFDSFVRRLCTVNSDIYSLNGHPACDFYIRYENLENDIRSVCTTLCLPSSTIQLPNHRTTIRNDKEYRKFYTLELRDYVAAKCAVEIKMFSYTF